MLEFDFNGNLQPYHAIESTLEEVEQFFVINFPVSKTRKNLFETYRLYKAALQSEIGADFFQYLNGSFISKKLNPKDIDLVTFINADIIKSREQVLKKFKNRNQFAGIDGYIQEVHPQNHINFKQFQLDLLYWNDLFTKSRAEKPKGYIKIIFDHGSNT